MDCSRRCRCAEGIVRDDQVSIRGCATLMGCAPVGRHGGQTVRDGDSRYARQRCGVDARLREKQLPGHCEHAGPVRRRECRKLPSPLTGGGPPDDGKMGTRVRWSAQWIEGTRIGGNGGATKRSGYGKRNERCGSRVWVRRDDGWKRRDELPRHRERAGGDGGGSVESSCRHRRLLQSVLDEWSDWWTARRLNLWNVHWRVGWKRRSWLRCRVHAPVRSPVRVLEGMPIGATGESAGAGIEVTRIGGNVRAEDGRMFGAIGSTRVGGLDGTAVGEKGRRCKRTWVSTILVFGDPMERESVVSTQGREGSFPRHRERAGGDGGEGVESSRRHHGIECRRGTWMGGR